MYAIFAYIGMVLEVNVGIYGIHGVSGHEFFLSIASLVTDWSFSRSHDRCATDRFTRSVSPVLHERRRRAAEDVREFRGADAALLLGARCGGVP